MKRYLTCLTLGLALLAGSGCLLAADADVTISGSGATFPKPLYEKWVSEYTKSHPNVKMNYTGKGSGGGIKDFTDKTVDFGATDGPMTDKQLSALKGEAFHIPMTMGAVVPIYNIPGIDKPLVFSGPVLADIYLGKIKKWNDAAIAGLNPDAKLPDQNITVVHRSDGSGTSYVFTDYLAKSSEEAKKTIGTATTPDWVSGQVGAKGNDGVAAEVQRSGGSIGYVELIYALANKISYGSMKNANGKVVAASIESTTAAAATLKDIPADLRVSITNAPGDDAYPISTFTWILVYKDQPDANKGKALADFLWWATHDGQKFSADLHYAPLPKSIVELDEQKLQALKADNKAIMGAAN